MWLGIGVKIVNWWRRAAANGPFSGHATLTNGLVSYWKLDEQSGVRYDSITASANDLTDNNTVTSVNAGPSGVVAEFTKATSEYLSSTMSTTFGGARGVYVAGWFRPLTVDATYEFVLDLGSSFSVNETISVYRFQDYLNLNVGDGVTAKQNIIAACLTAGNWHFIEAWTVAGENRAWFKVNRGAAVATTTNAGPPVTSTAITFGSVSDRNNYFQSGNEGNFGIWDNVIPDGSTLFNSGNGKSYSALTTAEKVGLVSYWNLAEASGTRYDSHGANDLTDNNTVTSVTNSGPPPKNIAAQFTAANSETLSIADNASFNFTGDWSFSFWFQPNVAATRGLVSKDDVGANREIYTAITATNFVAAVAGGGDLNNNNGGAGYTTDQWYHASVWYTGGSLFTRINDTNETTAVRAAATDKAAPFLIGDIGAGFHAYMQGQIDEVGFWTRALTAQERTDLYNSGAGLFY